jgi:hypothetical protein
MKTRPRFTIEIEAPATNYDLDGIHRLKILLKRMIRSHGLRCIRAVEVEAKEKSPDCEQDG